MRITPPPDHDYPEPVIEIQNDRSEWIRDYLNVPNWVCPACGLTMMGRCKRCADPKCRLERPK